jgi:hypothetical protein|tara:strand:+ start:617 stop:754 length:138 start_codon:yes stop_codon:yes gene_type:complete
MISRIEQVRLALMILGNVQQKPETVEETIAVLEKIIKRLKLNQEI